MRLRRLCFNCLLVAGSAACGSASTPAPATPAWTTPTAAPTVMPSPISGPSLSPAPGAAPCAPGCTYKDMVVGLVQTGSETNWHVANSVSFKTAAVDLGVTLRYFDSAAFSLDQSRSFQYFVEDAKVNVIVVGAIHPSGWDDPLRTAQAAGKIVILEDRRVDAPADLYATYVGSDFQEEGRKAGREMIELLTGSESKHIWEVSGSAGSTAAVGRGLGFRQAIRDNGIVITRTGAGDWLTDDAARLVSRWLKEGKDVDGIIAHNDGMAIGVINALKAAGLKPGKDIKIVGFDATAQGFKAMIAGELNVDVECSPVLAPQVYDAALKAMNGQPLPKWIPTVETVFRSTDPNLAEILKTRTY